MNNDEYIVLSAEGLKRLLGSERKEYQNTREVGKTVNANDDDVDAAMC